MRFRLLIVSLVAGAALGLFAPDRTVQAQINQIDGSTGQFTATPSGGNYIISFGTNSGAVQALNGVPVPLASQNTIGFSSITLLGANGGAAFNTNFGALDTGSKNINGLTSGTAIFNNFSGLLWGVGSFQPNVLGLSGFESLFSNNTIPNLNLTPFASAGNNNAITFSLNIAAGSFVALFNSGTTFTGTGSFSQIAGQGPQPPVPEPSSLAIWGTLIGAGWLTRRLRRK